MEIANKFRKPAIVFKRKVTVSGGRRGGMGAGERIGTNPVPPIGS